LIFRAGGAGLRLQVKPEAGGEGLPAARGEPDGALPGGAGHPAGGEHRGQPGPRGSLHRRAALARVAAAIGWLAVAALVIQLRRSPDLRGN
jgi:hypothetical protein